MAAEISRRWTGRTTVRVWRGGLFGMSFAVISILERYAACGRSGWNGRGGPECVSGADLPVLGWPSL